MARSSAHCWGHHGLHHEPQPFAGLDVRRVLESLAVLILQAAPGLDECVSVGRQIGEVPIEAALGDAEPLAEPVDAKRVGAAVGEDGESGLDPVVDRQPAAAPRGGVMDGSIRRPAA